jgi:serine/threonine-protein kinase
VALKRFARDAFPSDEDAIRALEEQALMLAPIASYNLVPILEYGEDDEGAYATMPFIEGASVLRMQSVQRNRHETITPLPTVIAVRILLDVLEALDTLHGATHGPKSQGFVHGNISPDNLLVSLDGRCWVTDFACAAPAASVGSTTSVKSRQGTAGYAAPEVVRGERPSPWSDTYSAAVVLWELLSGRRLFAAPTPQMTNRLVMGSYVPDLVAIAPSVPRPIAQVCGRGVARNPAERFSSAHEFRQTLAEALEESFGPVKQEAVAAYLARRCTQHLHYLRDLKVSTEGPSPSGMRPVARGETIPRDT